MHRYIDSAKVAAPVFQSTQLLDQLRERIRYLHYISLPALGPLFIRWHARLGGMRHPRDMGQAEEEAFLTMLASERQVSPATHRQALSALLFLYKEVLGQDAGDGRGYLPELGRCLPQQRALNPAVHCLHHGMPGQAEDQVSRPVNQPLDSRRHKSDHKMTEDETISVAAKNWAGTV